MQAPQVLIFTQARPFEPFRMFLSDGRTVDVNHVESFMLAEWAAAIWLYRKSGQVEVVDTAAVTGLITLSATDFDAFVPQPPPLPQPPESE